MSPTGYAAAKRSRKATKSSARLRGRISRCTCPVRALRAPNTARLAFWPGVGTRQAGPFHPAGPDNGQQLQVALVQEQERRRGRQRLLQPLQLQRALPDRPCAGPRARASPGPAGAAPSASPSRAEWRRTLPATAPARSAPPGRRPAARRPAALHQPAIARRIAGLGIHNLPGQAVARGPARPRTVVQPDGARRW